MNFGQDWTFENCFFFQIYFFSNLLFQICFFLINVLFWISFFLKFFHHIFCASHSSFKYLLVLPICTCTMLIKFSISSPTVCSWSFWDCTCSQSFFCLSLCNLARTRICSFRCFDLLKIFLGLLKSSELIETSELEVWVFVRERPFEAVVLILVGG